MKTLKGVGFVVLWTLILLAGSTVDLRAWTGSQAPSVSAITVPVGVGTTKRPCHRKHRTPQPAVCYIRP